MVKILLHLWLVLYYINGWFLLHLWLNFITFMVTIAFMLVITFGGDRDVYSFNDCDKKYKIEL